MKQCETCGAFNDDGAKFCTSCGSQISQAAASPQPEPAAESPVYPAYPAESPYVSYAPKVATKKEFVDLPENRKSKILMMIAGILCYVAAGLDIIVTLLGSAVLDIDKGTILWVMAEVAILVILGLFIHIKQSKVCALLLLIYAIVAFVYGLIVNGSYGIGPVVAGILAVNGAFPFDKAWKAYQAK